MYSEPNPYTCLQRLSMLPKVAVSIKRGGKCHRSKGREIRSWKVRSKIECKVEQVRTPLI